MAKKTSKRYRISRISAKILLGLLLFILLLLLFIRSPWGQDLIVQKLINSVSEKTGTQITLNKAYISFDGDVNVEGLYVEDLSGDTLVFSKSLEAHLALWPLIMGNGISISSVDWEGLTANIVRKDTVRGFNYQFLIDAYATQDSTAVPQDTTATTFSLGDLHFRNFDLNYEDAVSGTHATGKFREFNLEMEVFDLETMNFEVGQVGLSHANFVYKQEKPLPETQDTTSTAMPIFSIEKLTLTEVKAYYQSDPEQLTAKMDIGNFLLELPKANLVENRLVIDQLVLKNSEFLVKTHTEEATPQKQVAVAEKKTGFVWPEWDVIVNEVSLANNEATYFVNGERPQQGVFNPNAIAIENLHLQLNDFSLQNQTVKADLKNFGFIEASGIHLKKLAFGIRVDNDRFSIEDLVFNLNKNYVQGDFSASYASINGFLEDPGNATVSLEIPRLEIDLSDAFRFSPKLEKNDYLLALSQHQLTGNVSANGTLAHLKIPNLDLNWGQNTAINAKGMLKNVTEPENIHFDFPQFDLVSVRQDIVQFVEEDSLGIAIPEKIRLRSSFRGNPENLSATASVIIPEGEINLTGSFKNQQKIAFDLQFEAKEFDLGHLLQNEKLGVLTLSLNTKGEGENSNTLDAVLDANIVDFSYSGYHFEDLNIHGKITDGTGDISMDYKDQNLNLAMASTVKLDSISPVFVMDLNLKGADLQALGISARDIRAKIDLKARYEGNAEGYDVTATTENGVVVYDNESFLMGNITARAHIGLDTTSVDIANKIVDLKLRSNAGPTDFLTALQDHVKSYISEKEEMTDTIAPVELQLNATVSAAPILTEVLLPDLKRLDTVKIAVDFNQGRRKLNATVDLPFINYNGNEIDSLQLSIASDKTDFGATLSFNAINAGPIAINRTNLSAALANDRLYLDFASYNENDSLLVNVQSYLNVENDSLFFHIDPKELLLNGKDWDISPNNKLVLAEDFIGAQDFRLHRNNQAITIDAKTETEKNQFMVGFENFQLAAVLAFLNPENPLATGEMSGNFVVEAPFGNTGLIADLSIQNFTAMEVPLGDLVLNAKSLQTNAYKMDLGLSGGDIVLNLDGTYIADSTAAKLDLQLDLKELELDAIKNFTDGAITDTNGFISGNFQINGTTTEPEYQGSFTFHDAVFTVATLDAVFKIADQTIKVDDQGLYFDHFKIADENSSGFIVEGAVLTESFINPAFNLTFEAENFKALSSTKEDNELYYGTLVFDLKGKLNGDLNLPVVDLDLDIDPKTNLTYVIPPSEIAVVSRDGIVVFVNKEHPDNILTRNSEEKTTTITGIILNSTISLNEGSTFSVIIDEKTGDNLQVTGEGLLNFDISANGRTHLAGRYDIKDGHYLINLYSLVKRRFDIKDGSSITWFGDPLEASLDITAVHEVETSAASLMAAQTSGTVETRFQQELTFLVYLYVDGWLMQPKLSFGLGMTEEERGSLGGQVYGTIQQLNQQESELNKQVFSLLVLNRFYPQGNSFGAQGGALTLARDNLNQLLSDQLNLFSDRLMGDTGFKLNFGLDSYTDYQGESPQEKTALEISAEKRFFDDRLIVEVGSSVDIQGSDPNKTANQPFIENVSIQYLLTEDGRFRLKGFRKNTFENVIDGQVIINGIALIFQKQFNTFAELWESEMKKDRKGKGVEKEEEREKNKE